MKVAQPRIVAYDNKWMTVEGKPIVEKRWKVDGLYIDGMRVRKFFPQKKDAEKWLQEKLDQKDREGFAGLKVSDDLRIIAARCAEDLKPYGVSLRDAVNHYISHRKAIDRSCTIESLITEFIEAKEKDGARPAYMRDLRGRLTPFSKAFGSKMTAEISPRLLDDWLRELSGKGVH